MPEPANCCFHIFFKWIKLSMASADGRLGRTVGVRLSGFPDRIRISGKDGGISRYVDLQSRRWKPFKAYNTIEKQVTAVKNISIECHRFLIADLVAPTESEMNTILNTMMVSIANGAPVYVHCRGGIGRTGTVIGCYLLQNGIANPTNVFEVIAGLRRHDRKKHLVSPETEEQRNFVINWLSKEKVTPTRHPRTLGCLLGGGVGDALGGPVEFMRVGEIRDRYGEAG